MSPRQDRDDLFDTIVRELKRSTPKPSEKLLSAIQELYEQAGARDDGTDAPPAQGVGARSNVVIRTGRHDGAYLPSGHEWLQITKDGRGYLFRKDHPKLQRFDAGELRLVRFLGDRLRTLQAHRQKPELVEALGVLHEILEGHAPGRQWAAVLARCLESEALKHAQERNRRALAQPRGEEVLRSGAAILRFVREHAADTPRWLNAATIDEVLPRVALGGSGRGNKKSARALVSDIERTHAKRPKKRRRKLKR